MPQYKCFSEKRRSTEGPLYVAYGINAIKNGELLASIPDISTNRTDLERLVQTCNELKLAPIHLMDVVEDFLFESECENEADMATP